ncbi:MAG: hypothetical protein GY854_12935 [Deltaproteobacteria bacterium]|nr:hypothetical protein [Deltaproteobacteria bacterium]
MMEEKDLNRLCEGLKDSKSPLVLTYSAGNTESDFGGQLEKAARQVVDASDGNAQLRQGDGGGLVARPGITFSCGDVDNLHYLAVPDGLEAAPFVDTILGLVSSPVAPAADWERSLTDLTRPASLIVFVAPACSHCPNAAREAGRIAVVSKAVNVSIIDVQQYPALAERFKVQSVPHTLLDEGMSWTGVVPAEKLAEQVLVRSSDAAEAELFLSLIEDGRLEEAARRLEADPGTAAHFYAAWKTSATSLRISLLLTVEDILEEGSTVLGGITKDLIELLKSEDAALRGDTADLLGRIGDPSALQALDALKNDPNPDVAEIAAEAIDEIRESSEAS